MQKASFVLQISAELNLEKMQAVSLFYTKTYLYTKNQEHICIDDIYDVDFGWSL